VTGRSRPAEVRTALVVARGHGGFNAAVVLRAPE
jgi:act minimal PKS chain-length factor (CLF/KS beta)